MIASRTTIASTLTRSRLKEGAMMASVTYREDCAECVCAVDSASARRVDWRRGSSGSAGGGGANSGREIMKRAIANTGSRPPAYLASDTDEPSVSSSRASLTRRYTCDRCQGVAPARSMRVL